MCLNLATHQYLNGVNIYGLFQKIQLKIQDIQLLTKGLKKRFTFGDWVPPVGDDRTPNPHIEMIVIQRFITSYQHH